MTTNATPNRKRPSYSRPTKFPARLSTMLSASQRDKIDELVRSRDSTLGEISRSLLSDGLALDAAFDARPGLRADVERMARDGDVDVSAAIGTMLDFAVRESSRRQERNARLAFGVASGLSEMGFSVDGVSVNGTDLRAAGY